MNAEAELLGAYQNWRRLALAQARAVQSRNWKLFSDCHQAVEQHQSRLAGLTQAARDEWRRAGCDLAAKEKEFHALLGEITGLIRRNHELIHARRLVAHEKLARLVECGQNLRRLRHSYGSHPAPCRGS